MSLSVKSSMLDLNILTPDPSNVQMETSTKIMSNATNLLLDWLIAQSDNSILVSDANSEQFKCDSEVSSIDIE